MIEKIIYFAFVFVLLNISITAKIKGPKINKTIRAMSLSENGLIADLYK